MNKIRYLLDYVVVDQHRQSHEDFVFLIHFYNLWCR